MTISDIMLNNSVNTQNNVSANVRLNSVNSNNLKPDNIQNKQSEDNFNGKRIDKKKILTYTIAASALASLLAIGMDFCFAKGKHVKNLWNKLTRSAKETKPDINPEVKPQAKPTSQPDINPEVKPQAKPTSQPNIKPKAKIETITEKNYIDSETLSPVKEKWQGKNLLERTTKTENGLVTTSYKDGKIESIFTNGKAFQELKIYASDGKTVKETYFRNFGTLHIKKGEKELLIPQVSEELFADAVKISQKYSKTSKVELEKVYTEVLSGNPKNMSLFEFNILETHLDELNMTVPNITKETSIPKHGHYNAINHQIRRVMSGEEPPSEWINKKMVEGVNRRMAETLPPLEKDCIFYRGLGAKEIPQIIEGKVGDIVVPDKGFAYTSWNKHYAKEYGDGTILTIKTPKGARVSRNNANFGEALFPSGAQYRIISKAKTPASEVYPDGQWRIVLEYILPKS